MPELPEVETTCRGIAPHIEGKKVNDVVVRQRQLRWPIPARLKSTLQGLSIQQVQRRGKYVLLQTAKGTLIIHLGMSGQLQIVTAKTLLKKHDHVDIVFNKKVILRFNDPRRFGCVLWTSDSIENHKLIKNLGPEPLTEEFNHDYLYKLSRKRTAPIKNFIMDSHIVVGVGNIYANEALFLSGIRPNRKTNKITKKETELFVANIKEVLATAIEVGGTTLQDFVNAEGKPGYFQQQLLVYGRAGLPCVQCKTLLTEIRLAQRSTVFCKTCQR